VLCFDIRRRFHFYLSGILMSNVVALKTKNMIDKMVDQVHREFAAAVADTKRADRARIRAGKLLIELRQRIEAGEAGQGIKWGKWCGENIARSKRDINRCIKLAQAKDPEAAHDEEKTEAVERMQKNRDERSSHPVQYILELIAELNQEQRRQLFSEIGRIYAYPDQDN
jgi:hypothetical protein